MFWLGGRWIRDSEVVCRSETQLDNESEKEETPGVRETGF